MKFKYLSHKICVVLLVLMWTVSGVSAQTSVLRPPRQEKLLNGLKVLIWNDPSAEKVDVRLRVHSGSAFDPQGKEGVMRLLSENFFPNEALREFFTEDLGGSLKVEAKYDYIQITATATPDKVLPLLETIATAISSPTIDKETTAKLKAAHLLTVSRLNLDPVYVADQAVAARLFGAFPYGRPISGTAASIGKIDFADLIGARQRFLASDNASLSIRGKIDANVIYRAVRRYYGSWLKSDKLPPSTFRQPEPPRSGMPIFESPETNKSEFRFAVRGVARSDKDFYASVILTKILDRRFKQSERAKAFVRNEANTLPGALIFGVSDWNLGQIKRDGDKISLPSTEGYHTRALAEPLTSNEFDAAKRELVAMQATEDPVEMWLDAHTYALGTMEQRDSELQAVTLADAQRLLARLQKEPAAYILVFGETEPIRVDANKTN